MIQYVNSIGAAPRARRSPPVGPAVTTRAVAHHGRAPYLFPLGVMADRGSAPTVGAGDASVPPESGTRDDEGFHWLVGGGAPSGEPESAAVEDLVAMAAHDLNGVLGSILALAESSRERGDAAARAADLDDIADASRAAIDLVGVLAQAVGPSPIGSVTSPVEPIVRRAVRLAVWKQRRAASAAVEPTIDVEGDGGQVACRPVDLLRVVLNLVTNALEAGERGVPVQVALRLRTRAGEICLEVSDDGAGIAPAALERVSQPYVTTKEGGAGLGLAVVAAGATALGGRLGVRSEVGIGSTFRLVLPRAA
jgi:signal transduction histidine kinase